jgi:hypothetical protein
VHDEYQTRVTTTLPGPVLVDWAVAAWSMGKVAAMAGMTEKATLGRDRRCRSSGQAGISVRADETVAWDEQQKRGASLEAVSDEPGLDTRVSWVLHVTAAPKLRAQ